MALAPAYVYCANADVRNVLSRYGVNLRLNDSGGVTVGTGEEAELTEICYDATEEVNSYLAGRYDPIHLADSYLVKKWTKYIAAKELCERRGNPVPKALLLAVGTPEAQTGIYGRMVRVMNEVESLQSIPERVSPTMAWSNGRVQMGYPLRKWRVERPLNEQTPRQGPPQNLDYGAEFTPYPL